MKMLLNLFLIGDDIHYALMDKQANLNSIFSGEIELEKFDFIEFNQYIANANYYISLIKEKHHNKRSYELASDLNFWYNAVNGYLTTKIELGIM